MALGRALRRLLQRQYGAAVALGALGGVLAVTLLWLSTPAEEPQEDETAAAEPEAAPGSATTSADSQAAQIDYAHLPSVGTWMLPGRFRVSTAAEEPEEAREGPAAAEPGPAPGHSTATFADAQMDYAHLPSVGTWRHPRPFWVSTAIEEQPLVPQEPAEPALAPGLVLDAAPYARPAVQHLPSAATWIYPLPLRVSAATGEQQQAYAAVVEPEPGVPGLSHHAETPRVEQELRAPSQAQTPGELTPLAAQQEPAADFLPSVYSWLLPFPFTMSAAVEQLQQHAALAPAAVTEQEPSSSTEAPAEAPIEAAAAGVAAAPVPQLPLAAPALLVEDPQEQAPAVPAAPQAHPEPSVEAQRAPSQAGPAFRFLPSAATWLLPRPFEMSPADEEPAAAQDGAPADDQMAVMANAAATAIKLKRAGANRAVARSASPQRKKSFSMVLASAVGRICSPPSLRGGLMPGGRSRQLSSQQDFK